MCEFEFEVITATSTIAIITIFRFQCRPTVLARLTGQSICPPLFPCPLIRSIVDKLLKPAKNKSQLDS